VVASDAGDPARHEEVDGLAGEQAEVYEVPSAHDLVAIESLDLRERVLERVQVPVNVRDDGEAIGHVRSNQ